MKEKKKGERREEGRDSRGGSCQLRARKRERERERERERHTERDRERRESWQGGMAFLQQFPRTLPAVQDWARRDGVQSGPGPPSNMNRPRPRAEHFPNPGKAVLTGW